MAAELGQFIQEEHAMVGQRHVSRHRHVASADQPRIRDGMVGRATWAGRDQRRAIAREASDAMDTRGLHGLGEGHRRQDGGEPPGEHRLARPRGAEQEDVMVRTPASASFLQVHLKVKYRLGTWQLPLTARLVSMLSEPGPCAGPLERINPEALSNYPLLK
jgi:hypothetical protein